MKKLFFFFAVICLSASNLLVGQDSITFQDNFDNNDSEWFLVNREIYGAAINDGMLHVMINLEAGSWAVKKSIFIDPEKDYIISASIKQKTGTGSNGYGIVWGASDEENFHAFVITSGGQACVYSMRNNEVVQVKDWVNTNPGVIKPLGESNLMEIAKSGDNINFLVNGKIVFINPGLDFLGVKVGFVVNDVMTIAVDEITVRQDGAAINLIDKPINGYKKENLGMNINSPYSEVMPVISADGKTLFIAKYSPENTFGVNDCDIWHSSFENGTWNPLKRLGSPLNTKGGNTVISVSPDGNSILLMNKYNLDGSISPEGVSQSTKTAVGWAMPENIDVANYVNHNQYSSFYLSSDNMTLLMGIQPDDTWGQQDIYVSFRTGNGFTEPKNLGSTINTFGDEITPFLASDNVTLYFASDGRCGYGDCDIYISKRLDDTWTNWSEPQNMGSEINTPGWDSYYTLPASGDVAYIVSENNSLGKEDIFRIKVPESARPQPVVLIYGKVLNAKTKAPLSADIIFNDLKSNKTLGTASSNLSTGEYKIVLPYGKKYSFMANKENFYSISENIDVTHITKYEEIERNLLLSPIEVGEVIRLNNIFFDVNKSTLKAESYAELDRLVSLLVNNPQMQISINGHTDSDGDDASNMLLSQARAKAVAEYLIYKQISAARLVSKGFGETKPQAPNTTTQGKAMNRRVEFVIVKK